MSQLKQATWMDQVIVGAIFAVLGVALLALFVRVAEPAFRKPKAVFAGQRDAAPLLASLTTNRFQDTLSAIAAATRGGDPRVNTRLTGSAGFYRTEALITETFRRAGLETVKQTFSVSVPVTERCEIVDAEGRLLEGVSLYPFAPSGLMPMSLPDEGIQARLVAVESFSLSLLDGCDPKRTILMTTLGTGGGWYSLASIGVPAVIVYEDETSMKLRSSPDVRGNWDAMMSGEEQPFPRFYASGAIRDHAGKDVTIRCKTRLEHKQARNIIGVLKGDGSNPDALVLTAYYDSNSVIPELAPGGEEAIALASFLQLVDAFAPYAGKMSRDVVFVATAGHGQAMAGACQLMSAVGETYGDDRRRARFEARRKENVEQLAWSERALKALAEDALWDGSGLAQWWLAEAAPMRKWLSRCVSTVAGEITLEMQNRALGSRLAYMRAGSPVYRDGFNPGTATPAELGDDANQHPLLRVMRDDQLRADRAGSLVALLLPQLALRSEFVEWGMRARLAAYLEKVAAYHRLALQEAADCDAVRKVFGRYDKTLTISLLLNSGGSLGARDISVLTGLANAGPMVEPVGTLLSNALQDGVPREAGQPLWKVVYWGKADAGGSRAYPNRAVGGPVRASMVWTLFGQLAFSIDNYAFVPPKIGSPENEIGGLPTAVPVSQLQVIAPVLLDTAYGRFEFQKVPLDRGGNISELKGYAFGTAGTGQMVPSHPMAFNTFVRLTAGSSATLTAGVDCYPPLWVNPYGAYYREATISGVKRADAARYDDAGRILYFKDVGGAAEGVFQTEHVAGAAASSLNGGKRTNIALFRCSHVAFPDRSNPRTMRSFAGVSFLSASGISAPPNMRVDGAGIFLPPDFRFYVGLLDGAPDNPQVQTYRAFMLNVDLDPEKQSRVESDIQGRGYLAADTPNVTFIHFDAAESMLFTHGRRLKLQQQYRMADERMVDFHERGREWLDQARENRAAFLNLDAILNAGRSLSYAINNHPVIRSRISQAVLGILWYLGLLVPFVFFFEKLVFGFTDIRKQLAAMGGVFLVVFGLLRAMHPAFQMVRSSMMILIGFVMFLLTVIVTLMVGGKFKQNIKDLRSKEGRVEGADVNRSGVIGTAFMLGLNNMRRRKVRTSLTCITLILITFVMICFTSVSSDLVNIENVTGRTIWNGLQIQKRGLLPLSAAEVANIRDLYARRYPVTVHSWLVSPLLSTVLENPEIEIDRAYPLGDRIIKKRTKVSGSVQMEWCEPMFSGIDKLLTPNSRWFSRPPQTQAERQAALATGYSAMPAVILPDSVARTLDIIDQDLAGTNVVVQIRGETFRVAGIIDALSLSEYVGMDGKSLLPYDLNAIQALGTDQTGAAILPEDVKRLTGSDVILVDRHPPASKGEQIKIISCQVVFPKTAYTMPQLADSLKPVDFSDQRRLVLEYLERVGEPAYYGVEGIAYFGSRIRAKTFEGVLQILIPIIIAALTVFSTMRGSVYERRGEIYVYNAVGIAPNHVFFMFMAEAAVYAVVGAMMGYLLSQGVGRVLTALNLTRGMNMNYSSIETIYASTTIVLSVLLSTIIPARSAAKLAAPSENREWKMPPVINDTLEFDLPFTFTPYDRVAILSYMHRWMDAHGEGGVGQFFAAPPEVILRECPGEAAHVGALPAVVATVWLKPYDLGVSQRVEILLPTDTETGEFIARVRMLRLSGTTASWERTIKPFMSLLRKQFLNWRAATERERSEMYAEAKTLIQNARVEGESHGG
jgi:hypothetical protein